MSSIPVIDIFAGPGGLSEGFSRFGERDWLALVSGQQRRVRAAGHASFEVRLSIEMDAHAHQTLELRALARQLRGTRNWKLYLQHLQGTLSRASLFESAALTGRHASLEAWRATLGVVDNDTVDGRIHRALFRAERRPRGKEDEPWVLLGGPPCQAYSLIGRARNRGKLGYRLETDKRAYLYQEYLRIVAAHRPPVFVMENVKGLLSSKLDGGPLFERILSDLHQPAAATGDGDRSLRYRLYPVALNDGCAEAPALFRLGEASLQLHRFIAQMECHGVPQKRHRVILLGVREDVMREPQALERAGHRVPLVKVIGDLPPLRSGLSRQPDGPTQWCQALHRATHCEWFEGIAEGKVKQRLRRAVREARLVQAAGRGAEFLRDGAAPQYASEWYGPVGLSGIVLNHSTRGHIESDLHRYLYAACYAADQGCSPTLGQFPIGLLPNHANARETASGGGGFADRFRVQTADTPGTTVASHISKDGHYYIHYDPSQCRSMTVREAARVQTFPDDYYFCGSRTQQYRQVGNAVPPLFATQVASIVFDLLG